ncbi:MAG: AraC family transcriptional regulator [Phycisphaerae bacterium]|nr:AraC family transcriptional regulator [Phycisphaerae bacterium]
MMKYIKPTDILPRVQIVNYFQVKNLDSWGPRTIPDWELILIVAGQFAYETEDETIHIGSGHVLAIPPGRLHTFRRTDTASQAIISCIHGEMIPTGRWSRGDYRLRPEPQTVTRVENDWAIHSLFKQCNDVFSGYSRFRSASLQTLVRAIWLRLIEYWQGGYGQLLSPRMKKMLTFVRSHLRDSISRTDLAKQFSLTPQYVNALFKKEIGLSPTQFIHRERVMLAYRYIRDEGLSVKEASARVGFGDPFYFSRVFKKIMNLSPGALP